jgi:molybdopterin molybdotransferase
VVSTGDELVEPGAPLADWQVRRSNAHGVVAALRLRGSGDVADDHLRDDPAQLRERLAQHLARHDVVVLSGGVSAGRFDHVPAVLDGLGVRRVFHKVAQRPGKPLWFGVAAGGRAVFGLPGNPVSTLVCLVRYVVPALARLAGTVPATPLAVPLAADCSPPPGLTQFLPVRLVPGQDGATCAEPRPTRGSGDFGALAGTDGFVELAPGRAWRRGDAAAFQPW